MKIIDLAILVAVASIFALVFKNKFKSKKRKCDSCLCEKMCKNAKI